MKKPILFVFAFMLLAVAIPLQSHAEGFNADDPYGYLKAEFVKTKGDKAYLSLTNVTGKDIQSIRGGFKVNDADGNYVDSAGLTIQNPEGQVFLKNGETMEIAPFGISAESLGDTPKAHSYKFRITAVTFTDQTKTEFPL